MIFIIEYVFEDIIRYVLYLYLKDIINKNVIISINFKFYQEFGVF